MLELLEIHTQDLILEVYGDEPQYLELQIAALPSGGGGSGGTWADLIGKPSVFPPDDFVHVQTTPAAIWIINHNRGVQPALIGVMDTGGTEVDPNVIHQSVNQTILEFNPPIAGIARLI